MWGGEVCAWVRARLIFWALLQAPAAIREPWSISGQWREYQILGSEGSATMLPAWDHARFREVQAALEGLGCGEDGQALLCRMVAAVLHLGNLEFAEGAEGSESCALTSATQLDLCARLLQLEPTLLEQSLCRRVMGGGGGVEQYALQRPPSAARAVRNSICMRVYNLAFGWCVDLLNASTASTAAHASSMGSIGILDIFGFESLHRNGLPQLCINYANEALHSLFIEHALKQEQETYVREGVRWHHVDYEGNSHVLALIAERPSCIFGCLDDACRTTSASDVSFVRTLHASFASASAYTIPRSDADTRFIVSHYAGDVAYDTRHFVEMNRDDLSPEVRGLLEVHCSLEPLRVLAQQEAARRTPRDTMGGVRPAVRAQQRTTVVRDFSRSVDALLERLRATRPHYIRCLKPNQRLDPGLWDEEFVARQLACSGLLEVAMVRQAGFAHRRELESFFGFYKVCSRALYAQPAQVLLKRPAAERVRELMAELGIEPSDFLIGTRLVFLRDEALARLDLERQQFSSRVFNAVLLVQMWIVRYVRHVRQRLAHARVEEAERASRLAAEAAEAVDAVDAGSSLWRRARAAVSAVALPLAPSERGAAELLCAPRHAPAQADELAMREEAARRSAEHEARVQQIAHETVIRAVSAAEVGAALAAHERAAGTSARRITDLEHENSQLAALLAQARAEAQQHAAELERRAAEASGLRAEIAEVRSALAASREEVALGAEVGALREQLEATRDELRLVRAVPSPPPPPLQQAPSEGSDGASQVSAPKRLESADAEAASPASSALGTRPVEAVEAVEAPWPARDGLSISFRACELHEVASLREALQQVPLRGVEAVGPTEISHLDLSENRLHGGCDLSAFSALLSLDISGNATPDLSGLPPSLLHLNGSKNQLQTMHTIPHLPLLAELNLSSNQLVTVSQLSSGLPSLQVLLLADNRITALHGIASLASLTTLDLQRNLIARVSDARLLTLNPQLSDLSLGGNPLTSLPTYRASIIALLPELQTLDSQLTLAAPAVPAEARQLACHAPPGHDTPRGPPLDLSGDAMQPAPARPPPPLGPSIPSPPLHALDKRSQLAGSFTSPLAASGQPGASRAVPIASPVADRSRSRCTNAAAPYQPDMEAGAGAAIAAMAAAHLDLTVACRCQDERPGGMARPEARAVEGGYPEQRAEELWRIRALEAAGRQPTDGERGEGQHGEGQLAWQAQLQQAQPQQIEPQRVWIPEQQERRALPTSHEAISRTPACGSCTEVRRHAKMATSKEVSSLLKARHFRHQQGALLDGAQRHAVTGGREASRQVQRATTPREPGHSTPSPTGAPPAFAAATIASTVAAAAPKAASGPWTTPSERLVQTTDHRGLTRNFNTGSCRLHVAATGGTEVWERRPPRKAVEARSVPLAAKSWEAPAERDVLSKEARSTLLESLVTLEVHR